MFIDKKMVLCFALISLSHTISYSSEHQLIKMKERPFKESLIRGFKRGGRQGILFSSPIMMVGICNNYAADYALGLPGMAGLFGAVTGGFLATLSSLFPLKKEDFGRVMAREKFISRAGSIGAHTGTSIGTAALMMSLFFTFR